MLRCATAIFGLVVAVGCGDEGGPAPPDSSAPAPEIDAKSGEEPREAAPPEDETKAPPEAAEGGAPSEKPLLISEIEVEPLADTLGSKGAMKLKAKAKLNEAVDKSTYVHAKAICRKGEHHLADTGYVNANYQKPLQQYAVGEVADIEGTLFTQGVVDAELAPCQFDFRLAGAGGGVSIPLRTACFDGTSSKLGPCDPPIVAAALSGKGKELEVASVTVKPQTGFGSKGGIEASYIIKVSKPAEDNTKLTFKAACAVADKTFVDLGQANLMAGPFKYESGESVARAATLFWNPVFGFADPPGVCDVTVAAWRPKKGAFGQYEQDVLHRSCYRDAKVEDGKCNPSAPAPSPPAAVDAESLTIDNVLLEVVEPYGSKGRSVSAQAPGRREGGGRPWISRRGSRPRSRARSARSRAWRPPTCMASSSTTWSRGRRRASRVPRSRAMRWRARRAAAKRCSPEGAGSRPRAMSA